MHSSSPSTWPLPVSHRFPAPASSCSSPAPSPRLSRPAGPPRQCPGGVALTESKAVFFDQLYQCSLELYGLCRLAQNQGNTLASTDWERLVQNEDKLRHLMVSILPPAPSGTRGSENRRRKRKREETKEADSRKSKLPTLHSNAAAFAKRCSDCQTEVTRQWRKGPGGQSTLCNACGMRFSRRQKKLRAAGPNKTACRPQSPAGHESDHGRSPVSSPLPPSVVSSASAKMNVKTLLN